MDGSISCWTTVLALLLGLLLHRGILRCVETMIAKTRLWLSTPEKRRDTPEVSGLWIYPVKSLRAISMSDAKIGTKGLVNDRRFMLVCPSPPPQFGFLPGDATHRFLTQRQCPELATVDAVLTKTGVLNLTHGDDSVSVYPMKQSAAKFRARIWEDVVDVIDLGDDAAAFFAKIVGKDSEWKDVRLVEDASSRFSKDKYVPPIARTPFGGTPTVALSDGFPVLIACEASLEDLNKRLKAKGKTPIPMSRFRPNIVIRNTEAFEEDTWKIVRIGTTILHLVKGCPRCKQSCTDQVTGEVDDEPLSTLQEYRALGCDPADVYFAQNAIAYGDSIAVGDSVQILERGLPVWDSESVAAE